MAPPEFTLRDSDIRLTAAQTRSILRGVQDVSQAGRAIKLPPGWRFESGDGHVLLSKARQVRSDPTTSVRRMFSHTSRNVQPSAVGSSTSTQSAVPDREAAARIIQGHFRHRRERQGRLYCSATVTAYHKPDGHQSGSYPSDLRVGDTTYRFFNQIIVNAPKSALQIPGNADGIIDVNSNDPDVRLKLDALQRDPEWQHLSRHFGTYIRFVKISDVVAIEPVRRSSQRFRNDDSYDKIACVGMDYTLDPDATRLGPLLVPRPHSPWVSRNYLARRCWHTTLFDSYADHFPQLGQKCQIQLQYPEDDKGRSLEEMVDLFFRPLRLALEVFRRSKAGIELVYHPSWSGKELTTSIHPACLRVLAHGDHVWPLRALPPSPAATIRVPAAPRRRRAVVRKYISSMDELVEQIRQTHKEAHESGSRGSRDLYWHEPHLHNILTSLVIDERYVPIVHAPDGKVASLGIRVDDRTAVTIRAYNTSVEHHSLPPFASPEEFECYMRCKDMITDVLRTSNHVSTYGPGVMDAVALCYRGPITCRLPACDDETHGGKSWPQMDISKCYTSMLMKLDFLPVTCEFDTFHAYDGRGVRRHRIYIVEAHINSIYLPKRFNMCSGDTLRHHQETAYTILSQLVPSKCLENSAITDVVRRVYEAPMRDCYKKATLNMEVGTLGKRFHTSCKSECYHQAEHARAEHTLGPEDKLGAVRDDSGRPLWIVSKRVREQMTSGFYWFNFMVLDRSLHEMCKLASKMEAAGLSVLAIKTDAIQYDGCAEEFMSTHRNLMQAPGSAHDNIGRIRHCTDTEPLPFKAWEPAQNDPPLLNPDLHCSPRTILPVHDRLCADSEMPAYLAQFYRYFDHQSRVAVLSRFPQSGKSWIMQQWVFARARRCLFVTPDNALSDQLAGMAREADKQTLDPARQGEPCPIIQCCTANRLFGIAADGSHFRGLDTSDFDTFIFEEAGRLTVSLLARVRMFLDKEAGDRKVLCNYDCRQNAPIESLNNVPSGYYERVLGNLFPIQIQLDTNKTVDTRQHQRLQDMEADLFVAELNPMQFCSKWFREVQERDISRGPRYITLENTTMSRINNRLSDRRGSQILLHVGQLWRCREHFDQAEAKSVVNLTYKLTALEATRCHLVSMSGLHELSVSRSRLLGSFEPPYASTCHSMQGTSTPEPLVICDIGHYHMTREWLWTSVTRKQGNLDDISWIRIDHDSKKRARSIALQKIQGYRAQDAARGIDHASVVDYIDVDWVLGEDRRLRNRCAGGLCGGSIMGYRYTVQRLDNRGDHADPLPHTKNNCTLVCLQCNRTIQ
ncbi:hypothetical protein CVIRNUC_004629 [Coccomyxa viridis]|uniref:Uncharacterized protein n=1 Tax=Coccomyxa viridis TaxID=1274662 RepID=A0AAV1I206_9CHLO|nr:hypothetical protein CVIRNUC_004629 [Coccomyxa viridis]